MTDQPRPTSHPAEHEGAQESDKPNEPVSREVIKPDWAELEEMDEKGEGPKVPDKSR